MGSIERAINVTNDTLTRYHIQRAHPCNNSFIGNSFLSQESRLISYLASPGSLVNFGAKEAP